MSYQIVNGCGEGIDDPSVEQMHQFLDWLVASDEEHGEVWLTHNETGWTLSCFPDSKLVYYRISDEREYKPRYLTNVARDKILELWRKLAKGQIDDLEKESWKPGHSPT